MAIMKVVVNGEVHIVDSPDVRTAKTWGRQQIKTEIDVSDATAADIRKLSEFDQIPVLARSKDEPAEVILDSKPAPGIVSKLVSMGAR